MGIITSYTDDTAASDGDRYLTVDESGETKLTSLDTMKEAILPEGGISGSMLSTSAITLGYAQVTANQTGITAITDLTSLSVTVTIPTGGRRIKITGAVNIQNSSAGGSTNLAIREGSTTLNAASVNNANSGYTVGLNCFYSTVPTAGSHTYKLSLSGAVGTTSLQATSVTPSFILVELI